MPAPLQRLSPANTRLSSLEVAVAIPRHQGRRITSSTTASAGTWPANETPDEKERNPGVYGTRHGNLSFGGVRRLTYGSAASSRAGGVGQVGVVGQGRRAGGPPFGLDSPGRPRFFLASLHRLLAARWAVPASISATWGPVVCHGSLCPSAGGTLGCGSPDRGAGPQQMPYWGNMGP